MIFRSRNLMVPYIKALTWVVPALFLARRRFVRSLGLTLNSMPTVTFAKFRAQAYQRSYRLRSYAAYRISERIKFLRHFRLKI